jgi:hypothetical protein
MGVKQCHRDFSFFTSANQAMGRVINMRGMFGGSFADMYSYMYSFNGDVRPVLGGMFLDATVFNKDIGRRDVSNVINMSHMFVNVDAFDQDLGGWDVGRRR